jgi:hypothetical protein
MSNPPDRPNRFVGLADPQPHVDAWPEWDEPLSKRPVVLDIVAARWRLARRFNSRPPVKPRTVLEREVNRAWDKHRRNSAKGANPALLK